jgi:ATP-binding cassette subfamily F protein uup
MAVTPSVSLVRATFGFGEPPIFTDISVGVARGERICLVGRNGSGKSTLLKALAGLVVLDSGERFVQPGAMVAYMPQDPAFRPGETAADHVLEGLPGHDDRSGTERYRAEAILAELGIDPDRPLVALSGGEARRISLARALVGEPDVLLLDEPTNHLDIPAIEWLEARLAAFRGAVVLISHDRALLARLSQRVLWLDRGQLRSLDQGYARFEEWSEGVLAAEAAEQDRLDKKIASETVWLRQGISARRTRNMGRVRALQSLRQERAARVAIGNVRLDAPGVSRGGRLVLELDHVGKSFPAGEEEGAAAGRPIIRSFSTRVLRGDRVGIIGPNGAGKSTLLKIMLGEMAPDRGTVRRGSNLMPAVFDQRREALDGTKTVWETLTGGRGDTVFVQGQPRHVVSYMRDFLFDDRLARHAVASLSGGERNRLLLAKVLAQESNLLVLDEPTNDLDLETLDLLEDVLSDYEGTLLLVSHDRDFLDRLVTSVIAFEGGGDVAEYVGGYTDYLRQRTVRPAAAPPAGRAAKPPPPKPTQPVRFGFKDKHDLQRLPGLMDALAREKQALERRLADPALYGDDPAGFARASERFASVAAELTAAEDKWLELELKRAEIEGGA